MIDKDDNLQVPVVVPAAGIGKRMASDIPKQYLTLAGKTILEHTVERLLAHPNVSKVIVALNSEDTFFNKLPLNDNPDVITVTGGSERCDSVLAGLKQVKDSPVAMVHDAARPCLTHEDISQLINHYQQTGRGAILASRVRDTMKRTNADNQISHSESRDNLWHALTPQLFATGLLIEALEKALAAKQTITDEASAMEYCNHPADVVVGRADNIKVTQPEDLDLAQFILKQQQRTVE
ncbi:2-C-methyl-D-erythritol 4-phosphate cytidylyltransferase [Thalassotalea sp. PS06]|uniref:2-C-methyl-D-erythritol 4-phosphate cytidylyltransferase n=1 Tax=Thalassotalea sp. PS06 TaxID=2594005 RepID=UPI0028C40331|nr:2-C-methyl-D-erythritol 4-phosphate cytidylyltransferase [Thalassotalea sp. PS06]